MVGSIRIVWGRAATRKHLKVLFVSIVVAAATACARNPAAPMSVNGNERTVTVGNLWKWHDYADVLAAADQHCNRYGRHARRMDRTKGFDCVQ